MNIFTSALHSIRAERASVKKNLHGLSSKLVRFFGREFSLSLAYFAHFSGRIGCLPGLLKLCGYADPHLPRIAVTLDKDICVKDRDWAQFIFGSIDVADGPLRFCPLELKSRLQSMARAKAVVCIPEGVVMLQKGTVVQAQLL